VGLVSSIVLEALESGALASAANAATFSGFMHFIRLFGGEIGTAAMNRIVTVRERFHDNALGLHIQAGNWLTDERVRALSGGLFPSSNGSDEAQSRAIGILSRQVRGQAYTMAISDGFVVICWMVVVYLLLLLFLRRAKFSYQDLRKL
jgi:DHA2 family multidrug resistance protein